VAKKGKHNYSMGRLKKKKMQDPRNPKFGGVPVG
jgi:hypothetical protein